MLSRDLFTSQRLADAQANQFPLESGQGFARNIGGRPAVTLTAPIPKLSVTSEPIQPVTATLTPINLDRPSAMQQQQQPIVINNNNNLNSGCEKKVEELPPAEPVNMNPKGLTNEEMNQRLFDILTVKDPEIACACTATDYYPVTNPTEGKYKFKYDVDVVYRDSDSDDAKWNTSRDLTLAYSRWAPNPDAEFRANSKATDVPPTKKILFIHDALDCRKSWWCIQKLISPFFDTIAVDLLGSGDSTYPRGIKSISKRETKFPWSFRTHAEYLINMTKIVWPDEFFYVVGNGWGAQIAVTMASLSDKIKGYTMLNPVGFTIPDDSDMNFTEFYKMAIYTNDDQLRNMEESFLAKVRNSLLNSLPGYTANSTTLKLILKQYANLDRVKILIDQMAALRDMPLQALPVTEDNPDGLMIQDIKVDGLIVSGINDIFYPADQQNLYPAVYYNSPIAVKKIKGGHYLHIEHPQIIAESIINYVREEEGFMGLTDSFIGYIGMSQGNERSMISGLRDLYF